VLVTAPVFQDWVEETWWGVHRAHTYLRVHDVEVQRHLRVVVVHHGRAHDDVDRGGAVQRRAERRRAHGAAEVLRQPTPGAALPACDGIQ
jgi:hypothetical protein